METCENCKYFKNFKYGYGCEKDRKILLEPKKCEKFTFDVESMLGNMFRGMKDNG
jgi:hypothetical protein